MKQNVPIPLVIVIVLVVVAVVFGIYTMSTKTENAKPMTLEESKAYMQKMMKDMNKTGGPAMPAPPLGDAP